DPDPALGPEVSQSLAHPYFCSPSSYPLAPAHGGEGQIGWNDRRHLARDVDYAACETVAQSYPREESAMSEVTKFVGLDVHKETIVVAVADRVGGEARTVGTFKNEPGVAKKLVKQLGPAQELHCCYEAGPTGYGLHRQLSELGALCWVIVPTLI